MYKFVACEKKKRERDRGERETEIEREGWGSTNDLHELSTNVNQSVVKHTHTPHNHKSNPFRPSIHSERVIYLKATQFNGKLASSSLLYRSELTTATQKPKDYSAPHCS